MERNRRWVILSLTLSMSILIILGGITIIIDPFFHYHAPLKLLQYPIENERYQNDGIVKHFEYDAVITGTSMTQNFKASEFDSIFGVNSIKVCFSGAGYKEINENLEQAIEANPDIRYILRGLDSDRLFKDKDWERFDSYPIYLYDDKPWNDVYYFFNKEVLINNTLNVISYTKSGRKTTDFDTYSNWTEGKTFGPEAVLNTYTRKETISSKRIQANVEDVELMKENLQQNVIDLISNHPDITFYLFFTPYSIYYWDSLNQNGMIERQLALEKNAIELLLEYDNIRLFSFNDKFEIICDLNNYKDTMHYSELINSKILQWMFDGTGLLTKENYRDYCNNVEKFYINFDYEGLFQN